MAILEPAANPEIVSVPITKIGEKFGQLRIVNPTADQAMLRSMEKYGQLTPVVINRASEDDYELLDGFKRLRASRALTAKALKARVMHLGLHAGKAAIMHLNWVGKSINHMEEALVVHSLFHEDGLTQVEIGTLLGRHKSWVSRRISLIERLSDEVQDNIRLGLLSVSIGAELAKLQRRNQETVLEIIRKHALTWRQVRKLVAVLQSSPSWNHDSILKSPWELFDDNGAPLSARKPEVKLSSSAMILMKKLLLVEGSCLSLTAAVNNSESFQLTDEDLLGISATSLRVIEAAELAMKRLGKAFLSKAPF